MSLPGGGRHAEVHWHGNDVLEIRSHGMGDDVYVSYFPVGVEIGHLFNAAPRERFELELEYDSIVFASATIEGVRVEGREVVVSHRRRDGSLAHEVLYPTILLGR